MARSTQNNTETVESPQVEDQAVTADPESPVPGTSEETETEAKPAKEKAEPAEVDLSSFEDAVKSAIEQAGDDELDEASKGTVLEAYRELDGQGAKTKARKYLRDQIGVYVMADNLGAAKTITVLNEFLTDAAGKSSGGGGTKKAKEPVDPTQAWVEQGTALTLALALHNENKPENLAADASDKVTEQFNALWNETVEYHAFHTGGKDGDAPEASDVAQNAVRLLAGRKTRASSASSGTRTSTYNGPTRSIAKHIESAFEGVEVGGHLKVADIVNHKSDEYGDDKPSAGAVSSALKSAKFSVEGVEPDSAETRPFGATKVAV